MASENRLKGSALDGSEGTGRSLGGTRKRNGKADGVTGKRRY
jgi:hypothetical protein